MGRQTAVLDGLAVCTHLSASSWKPCFGRPWCLFLPQQGFQWTHWITAPSACQNNNYQAWFPLPESLPTKHAFTAASELTDLFLGDARSVKTGQHGRVPGSVNAKAGKDFRAELIHEVLQDIDEKEYLRAVPRHKICLGRPGAFQVHEPMLCYVMICHTMLMMPQNATKAMILRHAVSCDAMMIIRYVITCFVMLRLDPPRYMMSWHAMLCNDVMLCPDMLQLMQWHMMQWRAILCQAAGLRSF